MTVLEQMSEDTRSVAILGHIRPDGDYLGSTLGPYNYLWLSYPDIWATMYLEESSPKFSYLKEYDTIRHQVNDECYELCVYLDGDGIQRLGDFGRYLNQADKNLCLDHHVANIRYGGTNMVPDEASSTCEVFFDQLGEGKLDCYTTKCLYAGIIHDTDVFKFSYTSVHTMKVAGKLMGKGIDSGAIIDNNFYRKTYIQNQILGKALLGSVTFFDGRYIFSTIHQSEMKFCGVDGEGMDDIIDQLRLMEGVEVVIFLYEAGPQESRASMRPQYLVDVSRIATFFGNGGHVRAAKYSMSGGVHSIINSLSVRIAKQLDAASGSQE